MKIEYIAMIIIAVVVGAGAFFGGIHYQKSTVPANPMIGFRQDRQLNGNAAQRNMNGRPVSGEIISQDGDSLTVKMQDGSSKIVNISDTTSYSKTDSVTKEDVRVGQTIAIFGTTNSDGSITAQNVQLNPMFRLSNPAPSGTPSQMRQ